MRYYCLACEKLIEIDSDDPNALSECPVCKGELEDGGLAPGTEINGYEIIEELGRGSYGIVYCSKQLNLERDVALKILSRNHEEEDFVLNFFREARAAAGLSHPNVVQAYDAGITDDGTCYFAMELVDGDTVDDKLENEGALRADEAYKISLKIASALEYAWDRRKLTHGDIKPENIIISRRGEPKLADLGLAKSAFDDDFGHIAATPLYAPPEVIKRNVDSVNVQTDIYSFGGTVYHMFAGVPPFNEEDSEKVMKMHLHDKHEPLYKRVPVITRELSDFVDRMLAKEPAERPESWSEIVEFFEDSAEDSFRNVDTEGKGKLTAANRVEKLIPALLVTILLGVTGWFIWDYFTVDKKIKEENVATSGIGTTAPKTISNEARWLRLKLNLPKASPGKACKDIESFQQRFQVLTPAVRKDIEDTKTFYTKAHKVFLKQVAIEEKINSQYEDVLIDIEHANLKGVTAKDMQKTVNTVRELLNQLEDDNQKASILGRGKRMQLSESVKKLEKKLAGTREQIIEGVQGNQSKQWKEFKQLQKQRKLDVNALFADVGKRNSWYNALNRFISMPANKRNQSSLNQCLKGVVVTNLTQEQKMLYRFAKKLYPEEIDLLKILFDHRNELVGKELPWLDKEHGGGKFIVKKVTDDHIFFYGKIAEGAFSGFKLYWKKFPKQRQYMAIGKWLIIPESKISRAEKITIAFWILDNKGQRTFYSYVDRHLSRKDAILCRDLVRELLASRREAAASKLFNRIRENWQNHQYNNAASEITDLKKQFAMTHCWSNSKKLVERLNTQLSLLSPIPRANGGAGSSSRLLDRSDFGKMLTQTTYTANHVLDLRVIKEVTRVKILDNLKSAFTQISAKYGRRKIAIRSSSVKPPDAAALAMQMRRRFHPGGLKNCYVAGLKFYAGDMQMASSNKQWLDNLSTKSRNMPLVNPYLLLGGGMVADLYMTDRGKYKIRTIFENLIRKYSSIRSGQYMEMQARIAASEYAMLNRRYDKVSGLLRRAASSSKISKLDLNRCHLSELLATSSELNSSIAKIKNINLAYQRISQNIEKRKTKKSIKRRTKRDDQWIKSVIDLSSGNTRAFELLPALSQCSNPELSASLLCSVVAGSEPSPSMIIKTVRMCEDILGENISTTEIWYRLQVLELAGSQTPQELIAMLERFDVDQRASAQPYVSRMLYVASIIRLLTGETDLKTESRVFESFHHNLNVALPGEKNSQLIFKGKLTLKFLADVAEKYGVKSVYWPAMLCVTVSTMNNNPDDAKKYTDFLRKYSKELMPEERLLLQRLPLFVKTVKTQDK